MTTFDEREKAFEAKFEHDQWMRFWIMVRRNKLVGLWAAEMMGMSDKESVAYARDLVTEDFDLPSKESPDKRLFDRVRKDLNEAGVELSDHRLLNRIAQLRDEAVRQIKKEEPS